MRSRLTPIPYAPHDGLLPRDQCGPVGFIMRVKGRTSLKTEQMSCNRRAARTTLAIMCWATWLILVGLGIRYIHVANAFQTPSGGIFAALALAGQMGLFVVIAALLPFVVGLRSHVLAARVLATVMFTFVILFVAVDAKLYELFRFHINAFVLNVVFTPGGFATMGIQPRDLAWSGLVVAAVIAGLWLAQRKIENKMRHNASRPPMRLGVVFLSMVAVTGMLERGIFAWADYTDDLTITRHADMLPLYEPFLIRGNLVNWLGEHTSSENSSMPMDAQSRLNYPDGSIKADILSPMNLVIVALESVRFDMLNPDVMPNLSSLARESQVFLSHHSGGNSTRFGLFSLIYGLDGLYWHHFLSERRPPALFNLLRNAGYEPRHFTSAPMNYPEFRQTVFANDRDVLMDDHVGPEPWQKDLAVLDGFKRHLEQRRSKASSKGGSQSPFYSVVFFDGPHGPYSFPPDQKKFEVSGAQVSSYFEILDRDKAIAALTRYKNSVHFADQHIGALVDALKEHNEFDNTVVYVTSDHGQEFWEYGHYGHNGAFNPMQAMVPSVLHVPGLSPARHEHWTEHQDFVPTVLRLLKADLNPQLVSNGRDLLDNAHRNHTIVCSFSECALRDPNGWIVFGTQSKKSLQLKYLDTNYRPISRTQGATAERLDILRQFFADRRFLSKH